MADQGRSKVRFHFSRSDNGDFAPICNICQALVKVKDGSTTNLHNHLKRKHDIQLLKQSFTSKSKADGDSSANAEVSGKQLAQLGMNMQ